MKKHIEDMIVAYEGKARECQDLIDTLKAQKSVFKNSRELVQFNRCVEELSLARTRRDLYQKVAEDLDDLLDHLQ